MFNSTPPTSSRPRRTGAGGRRQTIMRENNELPYVSPVSNYSYGSKVANLPKPPRLSDTKVGLADALTEKTAAVEARLQEEEVAKEKEREMTARRRGSREADSTQASMPPPSRAQSLVRDQSAVLEAPLEAAELSALSGVGMSHSFAGEFMIDPAVSNKVKQFDIGLSHEEGNSAQGKQSKRTVRSRPLHGKVQGNEEMKTAAMSNTDNSSGEESPGVFEDGENENNISKPLRPSTRSNGNFGMSHTNLSKSTTDIRNSRLSNSDRPRRRRVDGDKENYSTKKQDTFFGRTHRAAMNPTQPPTTAPRGGPIKNQDGPPVFWDAIFDWIFYHIHLIVPRIRTFQTLAFIALAITGLIVAVLAQTNPELYAKIGSPGRSMPVPSTKLPESVDEVAQRLVNVENSINSLQGRIEPWVQKELETLRKGLYNTIVKGNLASLKEQTQRLQSGSDVLSKRLQDRVSHDETWKQKIQDRLEQLLPIKQLVTVSNGAIKFSPQFERALQDLLVSPGSEKANISWKRFLDDNEGDLRATISNEYDILNKQRDGKDQERMRVMIVKEFEKFKQERVSRGEGFPRGSLADEFADLMEQRGNKDGEKLRSVIANEFRTWQKERTDRGESDNESQVVITKETVLQHVNPRLQEFKRDFLETVHASLDPRFEELRIRLERRQAVAISEMRNLVSSSGTVLAIPDSRPDFASQLAGARIWPYLTSASYLSKRPEGFIVKLLAKWLGGRPSHAPPPAVAIRPSQDVGDCWPFPAKAPGVLAIRLREEIVPTHVTIEHMERTRLVEEGTAPKVIEFWIAVGDKEKRDVLEQTSLSIANVTGTETDENRRIAPPGTHTDFVKLHTFDYDIEGMVSQTFELPREIIDKDIKSGLVAFKIMSNYGHEHYTCLYRVKVHGIDGRRESRNSDPEGPTESQTQAPVKSETKKGWFS
ncbi:hypothetical protein EDC01DRAFT_744871 [Geopyxis carbonaria]|nr:hypothetical protein EDC01DRAFT_744871 [Geopyxis carbonaria]